MRDKHADLARQGIVFGACLYVFAAPLQISASIAGWVIVGLSLCWLLATEKKWPDVRLGGVEKLMLVYLAWGLVSAALGADFAGSLKRLHSDATTFFVAFLFAAAFALRTAPQIPAAAAAGFTVAALFGIGQVVWMYATRHYVFMARGLIHHITYGEMMAFGACGALSALLLTPKEDLRRRLVLGACAAAMVAALLLSQARGPWLAFGVSALVLAWARKEARKILAAGAAVGLCLLVAVPQLGTAFHARFASIFDKTQVANSIRLTLWDIALKTFRDHPVTGSGPQTFREMVYHYHGGPVYGTESFSQAHNMYLHQLAERGVVGLVLFLALLGALWWSALKRWKRHPDLQSLWLLAALSGFWVMNITQNSYQTAMISMFVMFLWVWTMRTEGNA